MWRLKDFVCNFKETPLCKMVLMARWLQAYFLCLLCKAETTQHYSLINTKRHSEDLTHSWPRAQFADEKITHRPPLKKKWQAPLKLPWQTSIFIIIDNFEPIEVDDASPLHFTIALYCSAQDRDQSPSKERVYSENSTIQLRMCFGKKHRQAGL